MLVMMKNTCRPAWPNSGCWASASKVAAMKTREQQHVADDADRPGPDPAAQAADGRGEAEPVAEDLAPGDRVAGDGQVGVVEPW